jgi:hypothetical protein
MSAQPRQEFEIAADVILKCITLGDDQPGQPQCVNILDQIAKKAKVSRNRARYLVSVAVGKFNAAGLRALFEDFPE